MNEGNESEAERIKQSFNKALNRHGYGFQYSVLRAAWDLSGEASRWLFLAAEFPVEVQGAGTRVDFILSRISDYRYQGGFYMVAECKRANPALSNWCFARAPVVHEGRVHGHGGYDPLIMEYAEIDERGAVLAYAKQKSKLEHPYHVAVEVKSDAKGDPSGESGKPIEDAATQVLRGLNGLIEFARKTPQFLKEDKGAYFLPVIFTTARIWTTDADLASAQVATGNVDLGDSRFTERPWVAYQYHQSPGLKHAASPAERPGSLTELMDSEYVRTIPVVSAAGVAEFLRWSSEINLRW